MAEWSIGSRRNVVGFQWSDDDDLWRVALSPSEAHAIGEALLAHAERALALLDDVTEKHGANVVPMLPGVKRVKR